MYNMPILDAFSNKSPKFRQPCQHHLNLDDIVKFVDYFFEFETKSVNMLKNAQIFNRYEFSIA